MTIQGGGFGAAAVQMVLTSDDGDALDRAGEELQREMRTLHSLADPRPATPPTAPEIAIRPKPDQASRLGVTVESIATIARVATLGDIDANVAQADRRRTARPNPRAPAAERAHQHRHDPQAAGADRVRRRDHALSSVADVDFQAGPAEIERYRPPARASPSTPT